MKVDGQSAPGHDDLGLCDLRNNLFLILKDCPNREKPGIKVALNLTIDILKFNALAREREEWDKRGGAPGYVK